MPDVFGPFTTAALLEAGWFRDRGPLDASGVPGAAQTTPGAGELGLTTNGLTLTLALGRAHVRGAYYERTGTAWTYATPANTNPTLARIDRLVIRRDLPNRTVGPTVVQGTPAATPAPPALTQAEDGVWDLPLFRVTVPAASGTVLTVADDRVWVPPELLLAAAGNAIPGAVDGQYRDLAGLGLQRWNGAAAAWRGPATAVIFRDATWGAPGQTETFFDRFPKFYEAILPATFSNTTFAIATPLYGTAGFAESPVCFVTPSLGNGYNYTAQVDSITATQCTVVLRSGANLNGPLPFHFLAFGR